jgi:hypothetical protein
MFSMKQRVCESINERLDCLGRQWRQERPTAVLDRLYRLDLWKAFRDHDGALTRKEAKKACVYAENGP